MDNATETKPSAMPANPLNDKKWFAYIGDHHEGPFTVEEIQSKVSEGVVPADGFVWAEGMADWIPMSQIPVFGEGPCLTTLSKELPHEAAPEPSHNPPMTLVAASQVEKPDSTTLEARSTPALSTPQETRIRKPVSKKWGILIALLLFFSAASLGLLKPLFQSKLVQVLGQTVSESTRPLVSGAVLRLPALGKWFSPLPALDDVSPADYMELKNAVFVPMEKGSSAGLALSKADILSPVFYVSSNLLDGSQLDVRVEGLSDTLLNQLKFQSQTRITIQKKLGKIDPVRSPEGKAMPRGEYMVSVIERDGQPGRVVLIQKKYFLGGPRDETYISRLKDYHSRVKEKAASEMAEIKQFQDVLENQMISSGTTFSKLSHGTPSKKNLKAWHDFHEKWSKLETQVSASFKKLTPDSLANDYFYGPLYLMSQQASEDIDKLHDVHDAFSKPRSIPRLLKLSGVRRPPRQ